MHSAARLVFGLCGRPIRGSGPKGVYLISPRDTDKRIPSTDSPHTGTVSIRGVLTSDGGLAEAVDKAQWTVCGSECLIFLLRNVNGFLSDARRGPRRGGGRGVRPRVMMSSILPRRNDRAAYKQFCGTVLPIQQVSKQGCTFRYYCRPRSVEDEEPHRCSEALCEKLVLESGKMRVECPG